MSFHGVSFDRVFASQSRRHQSFLNVSNESMKRRAKGESKRTETTTRAARAIECVDYT
jgi:hypothetical protein